MAAVPLSVYESFSEVCDKTDEEERERKEREREREREREVRERERKVRERERLVSLLCSLASSNLV